MNEVDDKKRGFKLLTLGRNDCRNAGKGKGKGKEKEVVCGSLERELIGWGKQWSSLFSSFFSVSLFFVNDLTTGGLHLII